MSLLGPKYNVKCPYCGDRNELSKKQYKRQYNWKKRCDVCGETMMVT